MIRRQIPQRIIHRFSGSHRLIAPAGPATARLPRAGRGYGGYGELSVSADCPELLIPAGFTCVKLSETLAPSQANPDFVVPQAFDGMAAFPVGRQRVRLVRNHEIRDPVSRARPLDPRAYDALAGELLAAVTGQTILKSSIVSLGGLQLDLDAAVAGAEAAREQGLGRALFLVRVGEQLAGHSKDSMTSYLLGVLASQDLPLVRPAAPDTPIVLYGGGAFVSILDSMMRAEGFSEVRVVERETAEDAAVQGAVRIFERARALGVVA